MTLGPHSSGDFGSWMNSGLARTSWGHPVLLTQNSELAESESSVSCRLLAGLSLKAGPEKAHFCASHGGGPWAGTWVSPAVLLIDIWQAAADPPGGSSFSAKTKLGLKYSSLSHYS